MTDVGKQYALPASLSDKQRMMRALMNIRQPIPASQEFLKAQDWELQRQTEEKGVVSLDGEGILLWQGDITRLQVDAIVNAANSQMLGCWTPLHQCIDNCIHSAAGIELRQACHEQMQAQGHDEQTGKAKITLGYNLPAKHVIHTVGPIIPQGMVPTQEQEELLASCYHSCLNLAETYHLRSIAFCCISTGVFNFPNERAAEIALATVRKWFALHQTPTITQVVFNVFKDNDHEIYQRLLTED